MVSFALVAAMETLVEVTAGAYVPLAGTDADISQVPAPKMETSPLKGLTTHAAALDVE
jgi:hypothetical protein